MPTYSNPTNAVIPVKNSSGGWTPLKPGETIETVYFHDHETLGLTEISETPYFNSVVAEDDLTSVAGSEVLVNPKADYAIVMKITGSVTVCRNNATEMAILRNHENSDPIVQIQLDGRTKRLVFSGSGGCRVVQFQKY